MKVEKVNLKNKFDLFSDYWNPKIVGKLNGQLVKLAKFKDEFVMHLHENEDEMFLVIEGILKMKLDNKTLEINAGEFVIIPRGTNHKPVAIGEVKVMLFEPNTTVNTGDIEDDFTVKNPKNFKVKNFVFIVKSNTSTVAHFGDSEWNPDMLSAGPFKNLNIDYAFLPVWYFIEDSSEVIVEKYIDADKYFIFHYPENLKKSQILSKHLLLNKVNTWIDLD